MIEEQFSEIIDTEFFMSKNNSPLDDIRIASPCSADWDEMYGDDRKRFCGDCKLNVYNLSGMTKAEAENLLVSSEGRLCVRLYRRADGSIITKDCPVGWAKVKQRSRAIATAVFSLVMSLFTGLLLVSVFSRQEKPVEVGTLIPTTTPTPKSTPGPEVYRTMGAIAPRSTPEQKPTPKVERKTQGMIEKVAAG
jgi:hypothetical protein